MVTTPPSPALAPLPPRPKAIAELPPSPAVLLADPPLPPPPPMDWAKMPEEWLPNVYSVSELVTAT